MAFGINKAVDVGIQYPIVFLVYRFLWLFRAVFVPHRAPHVYTGDTIVG